MILPGQTVYVELPMPLVEHVSAAHVRAITLTRAYLVMGGMSGWYPKEWIGRTAEEAEAKRAEIDARERAAR